MNKSRAHAWALFGAVLLVSACGGGGGDGASTPPSAPPPPVAPPPSAQEELLLAGFGPTGQAETMVVVDPAQPTPARLSTLVDHHLEVSHLTFDTAGRRVTLGGSTAVYYVRNGLLFQVSLRKNQSTRPLRISSLTNACTVDDWHPLSYSSGDDGWVQATDAGADGNCLTTTDNRQLFVRHGSPDTEAPTVLPDGVQILAPLPDPASASLLGFVARDARTTPSKLALYNPTFGYMSDITGGAGARSLELVSFRPGGPLTTSAYVRSGTALLRLDWSATSASLTSLRTSVSGGTTNSDDAVCLSDDAALYCADGLTLRRINSAGTASVLATLDAANGTEVQLRGLTSGHVVVQQGFGFDSLAANVFTVPKLGGSPLRLAAAQGTKFVLGIHGDEVVYSTYPGAGGSRAVRRIGADGSADRLVTAINNGFPMTVSSPTSPHLTSPPLDAVMWCDVAPGEPCLSGSIKSYDLQSSVSTTLGALTNTGANTISLYVSGYGFTGSPTLLTATAALTTTSGFVTDFYLVRPGAANSLVRITHNVP